MLTPEQRLHYARQLPLPRLGDAGQARLAEARVLVAGAGGLGTAALSSLAGAGVGRLTICEPDRLERHNLHRQLLYSSEDVGEPKGRLAAARLRELNPLVDVDWIDVSVDAGNVAALLVGHDLALDCGDDPALTRALAEACWPVGVPLVCAALHRFEGQLTRFDPCRPEAGCLRCLWPAEPRPDDFASCAEAGVLGAVAQLVGHWQALEAIGTLLDWSGGLAEDLLLIDLELQSTRRVRRHRRPDCPFCGEPEMTASPDAPRADLALLEVDPATPELAEFADWLVIDLREIGEPGPTIPAALAAEQRPLSALQMPDHGLPTDRDVLLVCAHGRRSLWAALQLRAAGLERCWSLRGGMNGWAGLP